jgi:N-acetylglucosaminyldiphosphoundecaprenol N-acetyl-beta-D-mannosaminyltransferase
MLVLNKEESYNVLGVDISPYSREEFYQIIDQRLMDHDTSAPPLFVVTVNPEIAIQTIIDNEFKDILSHSSINTADGVGISWAVNFQYGKKVDRITGSDSFEEICKICATHRQSVFLYGAMPGVADKTADILKERIPSLIVEGTYAPDSADVQLEDLPPHTQNSIRRASVVFVALGAPAQEKWIHNNLYRLPNCKLIIGIGGSFDFIAGSVKRAPLFMRKTGLEWAYRLYLQPSRWRRMMKLPLFAMNVILLKTSTPPQRMHLNKG